MLLALSRRRGRGCPWGLGARASPGRPGSLPQAGALRGVGLASAEPRTHLLGLRRQKGPAWGLLSSVPPWALPSPRCPRLSILGTSLAASP